MAMRLHYLEICYQLTMVEAKSSLRPGRSQTSIHITFLAACSRLKVANQQTGINGCAKMLNGINSIGRCCLDLQAPVPRMLKHLARYSRFAEHGKNS